jgi:hypothetical protein
MVSDFRASGSSVRCLKDDLLPNTLSPCPEAQGFILSIPLRSETIFFEMQVKDIVKHEKDNHANIYLVREGLFWRAYEKSMISFKWSDELEVV